MADPETRTTMDSTPITKFQLSVDRNPAFKAGQKEADLIDIVTWRNLAEESSNNLSKGQLVLIEGRIQNRSYETKDGLRRYVTEVVASNITLIEKGKAASQQVQPAKTAADDNAGEDSFLEEDLPF
jgi:single-strand DNA-binding protein